MTDERIKVLQECIDLMERKSRDYQNPNSSVRQAQHYRRGVGTIHDMIEQKLLRARSLVETAEQTPEVTPNFESLEDTYKDIINYCSFAVTFIRGKMDGQEAERDMFNRVSRINRVSVKTYATANCDQFVYSSAILAKKESAGLDPKSGGSDDPSLPPT